LYLVVGVRFKKAGKIYYFDPDRFPIEKNQFVIVETARGIEYGKAVTPVKEVSDEDVVLPLKKVIRMANERDIRVVEENRQSAKEAFEVCSQKISEHSLDMKLVDVEYTFDRNKVIFYFTAEGRVDFRELVKDLAAIFRTRIELRQIGVRDEAKMLGGIGPCGRILCCSSFLGDFEPVSIKMAKDQNLSLNPTKISGLCGRLMCCLKYENDQYETAIKELPDIGELAVTPLGNGRVIGLNILEKLVQVELTQPERVIEFSLNELIEYYQSQDQVDQPLFGK
jgi:cell fate regulator YaaT (PSP1 superfamily)